jgi:hypothetical protein
MKLPRALRKDSYARSLVHNVLVHPLMALLEPVSHDLAVRLHDSNARWAFDFDMEE